MTCFDYTTQIGNSTKLLPPIDESDFFINKIGHKKDIGLQGWWENVINHRYWQYTSNEFLKLLLLSINKDSNRLCFT